MSAPNVLRVPGNLLEVEVTLNGRAQEVILIDQRKPHARLFGPDKCDLVKETVRTQLVARIPEQHRAELALLLGDVADKVLRHQQEERQSAAGTDPARAGRAISFGRVELWPEAVDGEGLLDEVVAILRDHIILPSDAAEVITLWIAHAHALDAFDISPILAITSPVPGCGKTQVLRCLKALVPKPQMAAHATTPFIFRLIEAERPTLLIDEADSFLGESEKLRGLINSGYARDGVFGLTVGDDHEQRAFSTFCCKAIAAIGKLPQTIAERAIPVQMEKKTSDEKIKRIRDRTFEAVCEPIRRRFARWAQDNLETLRGARPDCPQELTDRQQDLWEPLLGIADAAGSTWGNRGRRAALTLCQVANEESDGAGVMLLADLRDIFAATDVDALFTEDLLNSLRGQPERPWATFHKGRPLDARGLGRVLRPFKVKSRTVHRRDGRDAKGYYREDLSGAFRRYLPPIAVHPSMSLSTNGLAPIPSRPPSDAGSPANIAKPLPIKKLDAWTAARGGIAAAADEGFL